MTERRVPVNGGELYVVDEGAGPPIMLLHAGIADLRSWDAMVPFLTRAGYRVIRADRRGFGRAETEAVPFSNRVDTIAVLDSCGVGRAVLVGNSQGGQIAYDTAIEFPDRVVAVVGVGAGLGGFEGNPTEAELAAFEEGDRLESAESIDADAMSGFEVRFWFDGPGQPPTRVASEIREAFMEMNREIYAPPRVSGDPIPSSRGPPPDSANCVALSSPSPARSTCPTSSSPRCSSRPRRRTPGPSSCLTSPT